MSIRSAAYNHDEDILLCRVYIETFEDPIIGVYQSSDRLWSRIEDAFNKEKLEHWEMRTKRSMQSRLDTIQKAVRRLHACIKQFENMHQSGASNEDIMLKAKVLFTKDTKFKSGWKFDHVWDIASPGVSSFSLNLNDSVIGSPSERPIGVKKAKLKRKSDDNTSLHINGMQETSEKMVEELRRINEQMQYHNALKEIKEENKILLKDLSKIRDPQLRTFIEAEQARIMEKRAQNQDQPDPFATGTFSEYFNNLGGSDANLSDY
ncbi:uncharacterized protein LOC124934504 [Impatiens glandulifera]|uniref:uncharacterized protein LOC124934504 n=1 Tax=Impatiens glandulifera TaxID=253017 RepID=UPI001FB09B0C|nr:uncharacterized protein LOC124934504 [Impatiens glandulifera]